MIPIDEDGFRAALDDGCPREGEHLDIKRELPGGDRGNNAIAVDLPARPFFEKRQRACPQGARDVREPEALAWYATG